MENKMKQEMEKYFDRLWPINRSITGPGLRDSFDIISEIIPLNRMKFETGSKVFDWTVPKEWSVRDAYFIDPDGMKHAQFKENNLHLLVYSTPFKGKVSLEELKQHLYTLPDKPDSIPYVTSFYNENWGFCISYNEMEKLPQGEYEVFIDSEHYHGCVDIGEAVIPGDSNKEIFFSTYMCHPSMANNELSGPLVMAFLYDRIKQIKNRRYTYRFAITTETIGTICYLSERGMHLKAHMLAGYVMTCIGDPGNFTYKQSRKKNCIADRAAKIILRDKSQHSIIPFDPGDNGSDERQYCSPGFNLPVGSLMRTMYRYFPEYHTSLDNKEFISFKSMEESVDIYFSIVEALESNFIWENTVRYCEPQLQPRGLYHAVSYDTLKTWENSSAAMLWLLNYADGKNDLLDIAEISGHKYELLANAASKLHKTSLLKIAESSKNEKSSQ